MAVFSPAYPLEEMEMTVAPAKLVLKAKTRDPSTMFQTYAQEVERI